MKQFRFWLLVTLALGCFVPSACNKPAASDDKELSDAINQAAHCEWIARDGIHYWDFWQQCLPKALKKAGESFTK